jgi:hypothetical protein
VLLKYDYKIKVALGMIGRKPRFQVAITIVQILKEKYPYSSSYKELEKEVNLRCKGKNPLLQHSLST